MELFYILLVLVINLVGMEAIYILLGAVIGLAGSILGSFMQNKKQDTLFNQRLRAEKIQYNNELKLSLINELIDNRLFFYQKFNRQYELTFYNKFHKIPMFFENDSIIEDYHKLQRNLMNRIHNEDNLRNLKPTYDGMINKMCAEVGIKPPNF